MYERGDMTREELAVLFNRFSAEVRELFRMVQEIDRSMNGESKRPIRVLIDRKLSRLLKIAAEIREGIRTRRRTGTGKENT